MTRLATEEAQTIVHAALPFFLSKPLSFLSFSTRVDAGLGVLGEAVVVGVVPELPELLDLSSFLLLDFWLARVAGDLP